MNLLKDLKDLSKLNIKSLTKTKNILLLVKIALLIKVFLIKYISSDIIMFYNTFEMRIIVAVVVAYVAYIDPVLAMLIVVVYLVGLQESKNRVVFDNNSDNVSNNIPNNVINSVVEDNVNNSNNNVVNNVAENVVANTVEDIANNSVVNVDENSVENNLVNPADLTITDNIQLGNPSNRNLDNIQNNITGVDPDSPVMSFKKTNDAQGLNFIKGFNSVSSKYSSF